MVEGVNEPMSLDCFGRFVASFVVNRGIKSSSGDFEEFFVDGGDVDSGGSGRVGHVEGTDSDSAFSSGRMGRMGGREVYLLVDLQQVRLEVEEGSR